MATVTTIANVLNVLTSVYDPFHPFILPASLHPSLLSNFHPNLTQIRNLHHPIINVLPWLSVRENSS
ncbi:hypothetical protein GQ43DRAFT_444699 [Delitschia confertaspora ATCC 74209]|uniref:Uncharacterized protein n=1 Tax=Delitschia confertaspora ATCC 74209 TaxID=1513339 RepID=A0A9P4JCR0_9PLEO|nr:hypothetical protein GQ43DRAFT_444699 [Delitschia confertaspora ATCC 74209]